MNLFLLSLLCLAGAAVSQPLPEDFVVLNEGTYANDLELDLMDQLESNGTMKLYLAEMFKMNSANSLLQSCDTNSGCPLVYLQAVKSGLKIYEEDSSINPVITIDAKEGIPWPKYFCRSTKKLLEYFYISTTSEVCLVPFPKIQSLTFAKCEPMGRCWRSEQEKTQSGSCRPSYFARHKLLVFCMKIHRPLNGNWKSHLVNLPQHCSCSA